jgi:hypothetical protein
MLMVLALRVKVTMVVNFLLEVMLSMLHTSTAKNPQLQLVNPR